jgi:murein DD-endopeptidase MepM/ murein hydrolase activator NlpD
LKNSLFSIKNLFKSPRVTKYILGVVFFASLIFSGYSLFFVYASGNSYSSLKSENYLLKKQVENMVSKYKDLDNKISELEKSSATLRTAVDLPPISKDELQMGVGGGYFDNSIDFMGHDAESELNKAVSLVDEMSRKINFEKDQYLKISDQLKENEKLSRAIPAIRPCTGIISDGFGMRMHPILHIRRMHEGVDFVTDIGTPVHATGDGIISFTGLKNGYGLEVEIDHGFGFRTVYAHLSKILVKRGEKVQRGEVIAKTGTSGLSTGPHLHYEVEHDGVKVNPADYFFDDLGFFELTAKD